MNSIKIKIVDYKTFFDDIRSIRFKVFVEEQNVPKELEIDELDEKAIHVLCYQDDKPIATGRIVPTDGHIGRIAVLKEYRGRYIGFMIMIFLIEKAKELNLPNVWLASQLYAKEFYVKLGFSEYGEIFYDAGIKHINMKKNIE